MIYREFGRTGLKVSLLGFGAMRLPPKDTWQEVCEEEAIPLLLEAMRRGVNYFDTAYVYPHSEETLGKALATADKDTQVCISTKNIVKENKPDEWRAQLDESIERLGRCPDVLHIHDARWEQIQQVFIYGGMLKTVRKAQDEGLFRFLGVSSHDRPDGIVKIIDTDEFDVVTVQHNFLYRRNEPVLARAAEKRVGVAIMGPLGGGRLISLASDGEGPDPKSVAQLALRFAMQSPGVCTVLSGMNQPEELECNLVAAATDDPLSDEQRVLLGKIAEQREGLAELYCTGCNYCMPCPQGVDIPRVFLLANQLKVAMHDPARLEYSHLRAMKVSAEQCIECGDCVDKCPQGIDIPVQLKKAHKDLTTW